MPSPARSERRLRSARKPVDMQVWSPSLGYVIGALAIVALTALIWLRGKWLFDQAKRFWDKLKEATLHIWLRASLAHNMQPTARHDGTQRTTTPHGSVCMHVRMRAVAPVALARGVGTAAPSVGSDCCAARHAEQRAAQTNRGSEGRSPA
jgi:hypothetical protein